jgi:hypothetical protein
VDVRRTKEKGKRAMDDISGDWNIVDTPLTGSSFFREPRFTDEQETRTGLVPDFLGEPRFTNEQETQGYISEIYFFENVGILNQCSPILKNRKYLSSALPY